MVYQAINNDRKIKLYVTGMLNGGVSEDSSWKHNFSRILNSNSDRNATELFYSFDDNMNVDNTVELLMLSAPKTPATYNSFGTPVAEFLNSLSSNKIFGVLSSVGATAFNTYSIYSDYTNSEEKTGRVSQVFQPWAKNVKSWSGSQGGITFEYEFKFNLGQYGLWNAKEEVVKPILNLVAPAFPQYLDSYSMAGPFPSTMELIARVIKKDSDSDDKLFSSADTTYPTETSDKIDTMLLEKMGNLISNVVKEAYKGFTYTIEFGKIVKFNDLIITDATTTFSNEVDQYGFPVAGSAKLKFEGLVPQTLLNGTGFGQISMFNNAKFGETTGV